MPVYEVTTTETVKRIYVIAATSEGDAKEKLLNAQYHKVYETDAYIDSIDTVEQQEAG